MKVNTNLKAGRATAIAVGAAALSIIHQTNVATHNTLSGAGSYISQSNSASVSQSVSNSGAVTAAAATS